MRLDHLVINTGLGMDAAVRLFDELGFQLTPRGHHSLGSINHLMMDPHSYLELVGVPATGTQRQEVLDSPIGLSGLVFRTEDAQRTYTHLAAQGFAPQEPLLLERPVTVDGATQMAQFRNVRMTAAEFPAGRVYFCQHLTPALVWRDAWLAHPNGFSGIAAMTVSAPDPAAEAARYAALTGGHAVQEKEGAWQVVGDGFALGIRAGRDAFVDATLTFDALDDIAARAAACDGAQYHGGTLTLPSLGVTLHCRAAGRAKA